MMEVYIISPYYSYGQLSGVDGKKNLKDLYEILENKENKRIIKLVNLKPRYDDKKKAYFLDFHGKMRQSSVKNMILVDG